MKRPRMRWALRGLILAVAAPGLFVATRWGSGNFGAVEPGRIYRSAQPSARSLPATIRRLGIRTVLNLRGPNPGQPWYDAERAAVVASGATLVDFPMSSDQWLSREQADELLRILDNSRYPLMIHCEWGAERTGLVSAICALLGPDASVEDARRAFATYYLFLPMRDGLVMRGHLDRYEEWLSGRRHSSEMFRSWLRTDYRPGSPSREHWECNPYPLKVVSKPGAGTVATWGRVPCPLANQRLGLRGSPSEEPVRR